MPNRRPVTLTVTGRARRGVVVGDEVVLRVASGYSLDPPAAPGSTGIRPASSSGSSSDPVQARPRARSSARFGLEFGFVARPSRARRSAGTGLAAPWAVARCRRPSPPSAHRSPTNHRNTAGPNVAWSTPTSPKLPSSAAAGVTEQRHRPPPRRRRRRSACPAQATAAAAAARTAARPRHAGRRRDDQQRHPDRAERRRRHRRQHRQRRDVAAEHGERTERRQARRARWTPPRPRPCRRSRSARTAPTAAVRLNCPNIESVIAYRSCIVDQCTTSEPTVTTPDSPTSASTPATAARTASGSHFGSGDAASVRRPTREPTPIAAPIACTASTPTNARSAFGVCSSVSTDDASWMTASADRRDQQRPAQRRRDDPADDEPRRVRLRWPPPWCARCPTPSPAPAAAASRRARGHRSTPAPGARPATCWRSRPRRRSCRCWR